LDPFVERTVLEGMSYGLSACGYDIRINDGCFLGAANQRLHPSFILGSSVERFRLPPYLVGIVHDKSTWARLGLAVQNTVIEPGWEGYLTLELTNHSRRGITIRPGSPIAQVIFHILDEETEFPYSGKYQNQEKGPQAARFE
jgi:dCTP deaminase